MTAAVRALVAGAAGAHSDDVLADVRLPTDHQSNRLYDVWIGERHLIAKEFLKADEFDTAPLREHRALQALAPLGCAPRVLHLEPAPTDARGPVVIYEFLAGEAWNRRAPSASELGQLAEAWLAMHEVAADWPSRGHGSSAASHAPAMRASFEAYARWAHAHHPPGERGAELALRTLNERLGLVHEIDGLEPLCCFCRSDTRFANFIRRPDGRIGMVDWEDSGLRDPAKDLADLVTHPNQEDLLAHAEWRPFFEPYLAARGGFDASLERRFELWRAAWSLAWLMWLLPAGMRRAEAGKLDGWTINSMPANDRLRRYLARAMAWPSHDIDGRVGDLAGVSFFPTDQSSGKL